MNTLILPQQKTTTNPADYVRKICDLFASVAFQVNTLSILSALFIVVGIITHFISIDNLFDRCIAFAAISSPILVIRLNAIKNFEAANIVYFLSIDAITLITDQTFPGQAGEAVLLYILPLFVIALLFENSRTRAICILAFTIQFLIYLYYARFFIEPADDTLLPKTAEKIKLIFDLAIFVQVLAVFSITAVKFYTTQLAQRSAEAQRKQAESERLAAEILAAKGAAIGQHMSHDLQAYYGNQALMVARFHNFISEGRIQLSPEHAAIIHDLAQATEHYSYILNNFLDFYRYESGYIDINHIEEMNLAETLKIVRDNHLYIADKKSVRIDISIDPNLPTLIENDRIKIEKITTNLLSNAVKHCDKETNVQMVLNWGESHFDIAISNKGLWQPPENIVPLSAYNEYIQSEQSRNRPGLGFRIAKELVDALGGSIKVVNLNEETRVIASFPVI